MPWTRTRVWGETRIDMVWMVAANPEQSRGDRAHRLLSGVRHCVTADDGQAGAGERGLTRFHVVALQPDDQRQLESGLFHGGDDAGGDDVAVHDAAEDIDENALHVA